ncbi:DnaJ domain [Carpediemonas membranifera]|uniref:DnaJ domain n=1 Tax=Carpediemonas membranifera TaxID=201153 RepID=A0A8J6DZF7_9EUKA|nr:DnaJ domain [Carpediemonas membranifera]|eukprot:KAG9390341.1 DnaJ domain [Carpediemonas membranifera]
MENGDDGEKFKMISMAYEILSSPARRASYDTKRAQRVRSASSMKPKRAGSARPQSAQPPPKRAEPVLVRGEVQITLEQGFVGGSFKAVLTDGTTVSVTVPAGSKHEQLIAFTVGMRSYHITVKYKPHPHFTIQGNNLCHTVLAPVTKFFQTDMELSLPTFNPQKRRNVRIPGLPRDGAIRKLDGKGYVNSQGQRGDLEITVEVDLPTELTSKHRAALKRVLAHGEATRLGMYLNQVIDIRADYPRSVVMRLMPSVDSATLAQYVPVPLDMMGLHNLSDGLLRRLMCATPIAKLGGLEAFLFPRLSAVAAPLQTDEALCRLLQLNGIPFVAVVSHKARHYLLTNNTPSYIPGEEWVTRYGTFKYGRLHLDPREYYHFYAHVRGYMSFYASTKSQVFCWGANSFGQLGLPLTFPHYDPLCPQTAVASIQTPTLAFTAPDGFEIDTVHTGVGYTAIRVLGGDEDRTFLAGVATAEHERRPTVTPAFLEVPESREPLYTGLHGSAFITADSQVLICGDGMQNVPKALGLAPSFETGVRYSLVPVGSLWAVVKDTDSRRSVKYLIDGSAKSETVIAARGKQIPTLPKENGRPLSIGNKLPVAKLPSFCSIGQVVSTPNMLVFARTPRYYQTADVFMNEPDVFHALIITDKAIRQVSVPYRVIAVSLVETMDTLYMFSFAKRADGNESHMHCYKVDRGTDELQIFEVNLVAHIGHSYRDHGASTYSRFGTDGKNVFLATSGFSGMYWLSGKSWSRASKGSVSMDKVCQNSACVNYCDLTLEYDTI